ELRESPRRRFVNAVNEDKVRQPPPSDWGQRKRGETPDEEAVALFLFTCSCYWRGAHSVAGVCAIRGHGADRSRRSERLADLSRFVQVLSLQPARADQRKQRCQSERCLDPHSRT